MSTLSVYVPFCDSHSSKSLQEGCFWLAEKKSAQEKISSEELIPFVARVLTNEERYRQWTVCKTIFVCCYYLLKAVFGQTKDLSDWWYHKENVVLLTKQVIGYAMNHRGIKLEEKFLSLLRITAVGCAYITLREYEQEPLYVCKSTCSLQGYFPLKTNAQPTQMIGSFIDCNECDSQSSVMVSRKHNPMLEHTQSEQGVIVQCKRLAKETMEIIRKNYEDFKTSGNEIISQEVIDRAVEARVALDRCYKMTHEYSLEESMEIKGYMEQCDQWLTEFTEASPDSLTTLDLYHLRKIHEKPIEAHYTDKEHGETYYQPDHTELGNLGWKYSEKGRYRKAITEEYDGRWYDPQTGRERNCHSVILEKDPKQVEYEQTGKVSGWFNTEAKEREWIDEIAQQRRLMKEMAEELREKAGSWGYESFVICTALDRKYMGLLERPVNQSIVLFHRLFCEEEAPPTLEGFSTEILEDTSQLERDKEILECLYAEFCMTNNPELREIQLAKAREMYLKLYGLWEDPLYHKDRKKADELYHLLKPYEEWLLQYQARSATEVVL